MLLNRHLKKRVTGLSIYTFKNIDQNYFWINRTTAIIQTECNSTLVDNSHEGFSEQITTDVTKKDIGTSLYSVEKNEKELL